MKGFAEEKRILPAFPVTPHLFASNPLHIGPSDVITNEEISQIIGSDLFIEEKLDGANCGMAYYNKNPIIRNRDHILRKGYQKDTPAKKQFASVWTWFYDHLSCFRALPEGVSVYGEWLVAQHGIYYDALPSWFVAYDLYDYQAQKFIDTHLARRYLSAAGFEVTPLLYLGGISVENLVNLSQAKTKFSKSETKVEGLYLKKGDGRWLTHRYKLLRPDYVPNALWSDEKIKYNALNDQ